MLLRYPWLVLAIGILLPLPSFAITISLNPVGTKVKMAANATISWTATATVANCNSSVIFSMLDQPEHGTFTLDGSFASNGKFSFTNNTTTAGKLGSVKEKIIISASCNADSVTATIKVSADSSSCSGDYPGMVIMDNTATNGATIQSNLGFFSGCSKSSTTIKTGWGGNSINIEDFHVLSRDTGGDPHKLMLSIGAEEADVSENLYGTDQQMDYFADGTHLFELARLRSTADWLSGTDTNGDPNITPDAGVAGAYGTMNMREFLQHIADGDTFYGITRVKIGLQQGQRSDCNSDCTTNALSQTTFDNGTTIQASDIYGFCNSTANGLYCGTHNNVTHCAPGVDFSNIEPGTTICGIALPDDAKIKAKGTLFLDFVDYATGDVIPLSRLAFAPRELYFKVSIPIMVNWSNDTNADGAMDGMGKIRSITAALTVGGEISNTGISFSDIPADSRASYEYQVGSALTSLTFAALSEADKYHMLFPSGYASGWAEAYDKLNITAASWKTLPPTSCTNSQGAQCTKFGVPSGASGIMAANQVRSSGFEDIPTYLYSGGLIDMHSHVNISGLLYVPQAMELEAKSNSIPGQSIATQQYVSGAIVVRDGFYIEANKSENSVTVISADPQSYSTAKTIAKSTEASFSGETGGPGSTNEDNNEQGNNNSTTSPCIGCASNGGNGGGNTMGKRLWMEVRPQ